MGLARKRLRTGSRLSRLVRLGLFGSLCALVGCSSLSTGHSLALGGNELVAPPPSMPQAVGAEGVLPPPLVQQPPVELAKVSLPPYRIEPPDVLLIDAVRLAPKAPYALQALDLLQIAALGTLPEAPLSGPFQVEPDGTVNLGPAYGRVKVAGLSSVAAAEAIRSHLAKTLTQPEVAVSLLQVAGQQQITGEHLVGPDGTVNLGLYGSVFVAGATLDEARAAIEAQLSTQLESPKVSVDVLAYNSKVFYVITEGAGFGDTVIRLPVTGNETVLDAVAQIGGLSRVSCKKKMWVARPAPAGTGCDQVLIVDWDEITKGGGTATNYQLLPGDRLFIAEDRLISLDSTLAKLISPAERLFGFTLLGGQTIQVLQNFPGGNFNNP